MLSSSEFCTVRYDILEIVCDQRTLPLLFISRKTWTVRARPDTNPDHNRAKTSILLISRWTMCEEASCANRSPFDLVCLQDIRDLGANSIPNLVQRGIKDAMNRLDRDFAKFADMSC